MGQARRRAASGIKKSHERRFRQHWLIYQDAFGRPVREETVRPKYDTGDALYLSEDPERLCQIRPLHPDDLPVGFACVPNDWMVVLPIPGMLTLRPHVPLPPALRENTEANAWAAWRLVLKTRPEFEALYAEFLKVAAE
jgi:hypothetical protein